MLNCFHLKLYPDFFPSLTEHKIAPNFTRKPPKSLLDSEGKTVKIEAQLSGSQPLTVTWYKDSGEICGCDKHEMSFVNNMAVLSLRSCSRSDSGVYTCSASNDAGKASCQVSVTISGMTTSYQEFRSVCLLLVNQNLFEL